MDAYAALAIALIAVVLLVVLLVAVVPAGSPGRLVRLCPRRGSEPDPFATHRALLGQVCTTRSVRVDRYVGTADAPGPDGAATRIQVRQNGEEDLPPGSTALIYDYEPDGGYYWVAAYDPRHDLSDGG
ncbi:hypothetical protein [Actinopolymorpha rutila]|uniref:Uncharacterized protein n=1 Tax=Actinopolymorpha rutila TaxID=446787 RepID=A0A852ZVX2_9ACTN|nr:hypothetical protein [Actinopolymorpha rutila]NYH93110.1 hypothetical protein [Actinopolymorpha rutila]